MASEIVADRGLNNIVVTETELSDVRGTEGFYHYRQYTATELAERYGVEDVWFLLYDGGLPTPEERANFAAEIARARHLPEHVHDVLPTIAAGSDNTLAALRTALSVLGSDFRPLWDLNPREKRADAITAVAAVPTLLTALYRLRRGEQPVTPRDDLSHADNYLYMLHGKRADPVHIRAIEQYLVSTIEHGFNASTFTARVIASTGADVVACLLGAIGALSGPLHGGAPSRALDTLDAIGSPDRIDSWITDRVRSGERIMGFGHAVYRTEDPRNGMLRQIARDLGGDRFDFALRVEERVVRLLRELKGRALPANVEYYAGVVMESCGIPRDMFTATFAVARTIGWGANILEQSADTKMIRPRARYVGPPAPQPLPDR